MFDTPLTGIAAPSTSAVASRGPSAPDLGVRFEQMLWAEMLSQAGLEKAFTLGGGEAASAFSRYIVEAIAEDLAAQHPLGLSRAALAEPEQG